jgi:hypothetical protein
LHHITDFRERAVVEECAGILELPQRQDAELEGIAIFEGNLLPPFVVEVRIISREPAQRLERVVANPDVEEILFDKLTDPGDVRVVGLLVEHRSAVAGVATCAAIRRGCEKEPGSLPLVFREGAVFAGQESVPGRVSGDDGSQESRCRPQDSLVVDEDIGVMHGIGLRCLFGDPAQENLTLLLPDAHQMLTKEAAVCRTIGLS